MGNIFDKQLNPAFQIPQRTNSPPHLRNRSNSSYNSDIDSFSIVEYVDTARTVISLLDNDFSRLEIIDFLEDINNPNAGQTNASNLNTQSTLYRQVIQNCSWTPKDSEYDFQMLVPSSSEFVEIQELFYKSTKKSNYIINKIVRVENPYLKGRFQLKRLELERRFGSVDTKLLFHGTNASNIDDICQNNFDWRKHGTGTGHRFGQGVSFSPKSYYASHYADKKKHDKVMIVAEVLMSTICKGTGNMILPDYCVTNNTKKTLRCDTSIKPDGDVVVKYADDEFYPAYLIYFHAIRLPLKKNKNRNNNTFNYLY